MANVSIVGVPDTRLVYDSNPTFAKYLGALKWEQYKIPASGLSNSMITFANLVTLGTNRVYSDSFEIEYTITATTTAGSTSFHVPSPSSITFRPFPLHQVTSQIRANINGAACMTRPDSWLDARSQYWEQKKLSKYCTVCPSRKPKLMLDSMTSSSDAPGRSLFPSIARSSSSGSTATMTEVPSASAQGFDMAGMANNSQIVNITYTPSSGTSTAGSMTFTIREPILCPPFNSRLDHPYGRPLFNINSLDITYTLDPLPLMFLYDTAAFQNITCNISSAKLCFQVASLAPDVAVPSNLLIPYNEYVPFITDVIPAGTEVPGGTQRTATSGVYTLAQVPNSIYVFVSNSLNAHQAQSAVANMTHTFAAIDHIEVTLGNNTLLLSTAEPYELYRMCLVNGLKDTSFHEFRQGTMYDTYNSANPGHPAFQCISNTTNNFVGSCLRMIPGIDLTIPDTELIPGSAANNLVFQAKVTYHFGNDVTANANTSGLSLWILFENTGTINITPNSAFIDMVPIKNVAAATSAANSAVVPAGPVTTAAEPTGEGAAGTATGAGFWDTLKNIGKKALGFAKENKLLSKAAKLVPGVGDTISAFADQMGYGYEGGYEGGALMDDNDFYN